MDSLIPIVVAGAAAACDPLHRDRPGRLLQRRPGPGPPDPARHHAGQEPRGAGAPGSRSSSGPSARLPVALSGIVSRYHVVVLHAKTEKRLAMAGNPGDLRVPDWLGIKAICAVVFAIIFFLVATFLMSFGVVGRDRRRRGRPRHRLHRSRVLAGPPRQGAPEGDHPADPGRPGPAHDLRPRRPRLRRRPRQGRREDAGPAVGRVPPGARRGPRRQGAPRRPARHHPAHRGAGRSPTSSARSSRPSSWASRSARCSRSSRSSCASSAASAPRRWPRRRRSRCSSRWSAASSRRCSSSSWARRSS